MEERKRYSEELKERVRAEYKKGEMGYKKLAKKYGVRPDVVKYIIKGPRKPKPKVIPEMKEDKEFKDIREEAEYYKTAAQYWKAYAQQLEKHPELRKKKISDTGNEHVQGQRNESDDVV